MLTFWPLRYQFKYLQFSVTSACRPTLLCQFPIIKSLMNGYVPKQLKHVKDRRDYSVLFPMYHIKANSALSCLHLCIKDRDKDNPR